MLARFQNYINARIGLLRLELVEKISKSITFALMAVVIIILFFLFLVFFSISIAFMLGKAWDNYGLGFGAVALFYLFVFLFVIAFKGMLIEQPILDISVKYLFEKDEEEEED